MSDQPTDQVQILLDAAIVADRNSGWASVVIPDSASALGTGRPVKVSGTIDGHHFDATMLPVGDGAHMIPVKAAIRNAIGKGIGDEVTVLIDRRRS